MGRIVSKTDKMRKLKVLVLRMADGLTQPIRKNLIFACFMVLLAVITLLIEVIGLHWKFPKFNIFSIVLDVYVLCLLLMAFPSKVRRWARVVVAALLYILAIIDVFCVQNFYAVIGPEILNVCLETTGRESSEFLDKYVHLSVLFSGVGLIVLCALLHLIISIRCKAVHRFTPAFSGLLALSILCSTAIALPSRINMGQLLMVNNVVDLDKHISNQTLNTPLNNLMFSMKTRKLANDGLRNLAEYQLTVSVDSCSHTSPTIVLIIGESYIKRHSQLYGYDKATTPRQLRRLQDSTLVAFSDVVTPSNLTSIVFKNVFSLHSVDDPADWSGYPLFPVLFRKAGYHVTFLTNQFVKTVKQDAFNITGGLFLNDTQLSQLQFDERNADSHQFDMDLLDDYRSIHAKSDWRLVMFHLAGQHIDFGKRCPDSLRQFSANDYMLRADLNDAERQLVADYDNATYYNDMVVDSILTTFSDEDAIVIYMPDHGEECFDELHRMGRLPQNDFSDRRAIRAEYEIQFWIWCSHSYEEQHPDVMTQIRTACNLPFMTDDLPYMLLSLAGIHCRYDQPERNLLSPQFNAKRKRLLGGKYDYDQ